MRSPMGRDGFTIPEITACSITPEVPSIAEYHVRNFVNLLLRSGYLKVLRKARHGKHLARYRLIRNTGPKPPVEKRVRATWDPNLHEVTHFPDLAS